jgi:hypothetical protein
MGNFVMIMKNPYLSLVVALICLQGAAQKKNESFRLNIRKTIAPIAIDGVGDDLAWKNTDVAKDFFMVLPMDKGKAIEKSEI